MAVPPDVHKTLVEKMNGGSFLARVSTYEREQEPYSSHRRQMRGCMYNLTASPPEDNETRNSDRLHLVSVIDHCRGGVIDSAVMKP